MAFLLAILMHDACVSHYFVDTFESFILIPEQIGTRMFKYVQDSVALCVKVLQTISVATPHGFIL